MTPRPEKVELSRVDLFLKSGLASPALSGQYVGHVPLLALSQQPAETFDSPTAPARGGCSLRRSRNPSDHIRTPVRRHASSGGMGSVPTGPTERSGGTSNTVAKKHHKREFPRAPNGGFVRQLRCRLVGVGRPVLAGWGPGSRGRHFRVAACSSAVVKRAFSRGRSPVPGGLNSRGTITARDRPPGKHLVGP